MLSQMNGVKGAAKRVNVSSTVYSVIYAAFLSSVMALPQYRSRQRRTYQLLSASVKSPTARADSVIL